MTVLKQTVPVVNARTRPYRGEPRGHAPDFDVRCEHGERCAAKPWTDIARGDDRAGAKSASARQTMGLPGADGQCAALYASMIEAGMRPRFLMS